MGSIIMEYNINLFETIHYYIFTYQTSSVNSVTRIWPRNSHTLVYCNCIVNQLKCRLGVHIVRHQTNITFVINQQNDSSPNIMRYDMICHVV